MHRTLEPEELMSDEAQAQAYALADFSEPNNLFIDLFTAHFTRPPPNSNVLDIGCGPADICIRFARQFPACQIDAIDGSAAMLALAQQNIEQAGLTKRVHLLKTHLPNTQLNSGHYQVILSNSLLHHLFEPKVLWETVKTVGISGAAVLIMDLIRPESLRQAEIMVQRYAADAPPILQRDYYNSLLAAFRLEEVADQLTAAGLTQFAVHEVSDRHLAVTGHLP